MAVDSPIDPRAILDFWFRDAAGDPARAQARQAVWFGASAAMDAEIRQRFGAAIEAAARGELSHWRDAARPALALVVLLDQFPRNVWRGTPRAFAHDSQALEIASASVAAGHLDALAPIEQAFLILPYEHSELLDAQRDCVQLSEQILNAAAAEWRPVLEVYADYARQHLALIERFGRFPHRNAVLGRESTPAERAFLGAGAESFGQSLR
jgi:uncharacterized protein (DUF924 family)